MYVYDFTGRAEEQHKRNITFEDVRHMYETRKSWDCGMSDMLRYGIIKSMGWKYVFHDELKKFVVKQYGSWHEYFAPNKTLLRKALYGRVERIVQI